MYFQRLPMELVRYIIEYVNDIDIRRNLGVYSKVNLSKFSILNNITITKHPLHFNNQETYFYRQYTLPNAYVSLDKRPTLIDDHIEMKICLYQGKVWSNFGLYRLRPKTEDPIDCVLKRYRGNYENHYWDYVEYSHILE